MYIDYVSQDIRDSPMAYYLRVSLTPVGHGRFVENDLDDCGLEGKFGNIEWYSEVSMRRLSSEVEKSDLGKPNLILPCRTVALQRKCPPSKFLFRPHSCSTSDCRFGEKKGWYFGHFRSGRGHLKAQTFCAPLDVR